MMPSAPPPGLCAQCRHHRRLESGRGSVFFLCEKAKADPSFVRYPRLPVVACRGHEPSGEASHDGPEPHGFH